jgi:hypothetical protein
MWKVCNEDMFCCSTRCSVHLAAAVETGKPYSAMDFLSTVNTFGMSLSVFGRSEVFTTAVRTRESFPTTNSCGAGCSLPLTRVYLATTIGTRERFYSTVNSCGMGYRATSVDVYLTTAVRTRERLS